MENKKKSLAAKKVQDPEWFEPKQADTAAGVSGKRNYEYFIILPEDPFKSFWDFLITLLILFVCVTAPWRLAFTDEDDTTWTVIGGIVDLFFLGDLVINFFTAYHDDEFNFIDDRKVRAAA